ncbi:PQ-loop domain-containing transporter [Spiroplasma clarkii]|uniref:MtN3 and saliva related transmembrane protein n=1 Tax=Spiroplasma clarkii TaxID=2139 RepID=A0A2K8KHU7_9MOLU|nr:hypothetical protein SCLAR_v1c09490 [Spiroplasma clarkii]
MIWTLIGIFASIFTFVRYVPQLIKVARTHNVRGISIISLLITVLFFILWSIQAIILKDYMVLSSSLLSLIQVIVILVLTFIWKDNSKINDKKWIYILKYHKKSKKNNTNQ